MNLPLRARLTALRRDNKKLKDENTLLKRQLDAALERGHQEICYDDIYDESGIVVGRAGVANG